MGVCVHMCVCDRHKKVERIGEEGIPICLCLGGLGDKYFLWMVASVRVSQRGETGIKRGSRHRFMVALECQASLLRRVGRYGIV